MMQNDPSPPRCRPRLKPWHVLGLLIVGHALVGAGIFGLGNHVRESTVEIVVGVYLSQPLLLALWAALSSQRFVERLLWTLFVGTLVAFFEEMNILRQEYYLLGLNMFTFLVSFSLTIIPLLIFRRATGWEVRPLVLKGRQSDYERGQFGIKHLLLMISATALALGLFKFLTDLGENSTFTLGEARFIVIILLIPITCTAWLTLKDRVKVMSVFIAVAATEAVNVVTLLILFAFLDPLSANDAIWRFLNANQQVALWQLGAAISILLTTLVLRWSGFRMVRVQRVKRRDVQCVERPAEGDATR